MDEWNPKMPPRDGDLTPEARVDVLWLVLAGLNIFIGVYGALDGRAWVALCAGVFAGLMLRASFPRGL